MQIFVKHTIKETPKSCIQFPIQLVEIIFEANLFFLFCVDHQRTRFYLPHANVLRGEKKSEQMLRAQ